MKKVFCYHFEGLQALLNETKASSSNRLYVFYKIGKTAGKHLCEILFIKNSFFREQLWETVS